MYELFQKQFLKLSMRSLCLSKRTLSAIVNLDHILEPYFLNGLNNYSSPQNKELIKQLLLDHNLDDVKRIKRWIDGRKRKERQYKSCTQEYGTSYVNIEDIKPPSGVTTLKYNQWQRHLENCPLEDASWVLQGIQNGFSLNSNSSVLESANRNLASSYQQPEVIQNYLEEEISFGTMSGPYKELPYKKAQINRFGVIPKSSGKWRLITDLSYPLGKSINDGVSYENYTVSYVGVSAAIEKILRLGKGCLLAKFDLQRAYRLIPIKEQERHLLVMKWNDAYYIDLALPFGARSAPRIFTRFTNVLEWIFQTYGSIENIQHSLDDFLVCGPPDSRVCKESLEACFRLCNELGIPIEHNKTEGPATQIKFLGLELDTEKMEIRIPTDKLDKIRGILEVWNNKRNGTKRELLSLIGSLYYCCQAVTIGRPFLTRLVKRAHSVEQLHHKVLLTRQEIDDLQWWFYLLNSWNGRSMLTDISNDKSVVKLHS